MYHIPAWIVVTTPPLYLFLFAIGSVGILWTVCKRGLALWRTDAELKDLIFLGLFAGPIVAVAALHSILYGGWRHLYFVYPAFLLIGVRGWQTVWTTGPAPVLRRGLLVVVTLAGTLGTAGWMWRAHPLQNVYFNVIAGTNVRAKYDLDYWGLGNRLALETILARDSRPSISVGPASETPVENSFDMIAPAERARLRKPSEGQNPDYLIDNYYGGRIVDDATIARDYALFDEHKIDGEVIFAIYRRKDGG
ncbi:MAG: hypothetical protein JSR24_19485 [Proteobacteria bacterium]|nr:hypothetical protein [Pseudomonadota bacterium]